jgi:DNA helicase-2/ATP-dependent DNA helicase PcrA
MTFSVRAAGELRLRVADLLGEQLARGVTAATFHSVCARLLREHAHLFGRTEHYTIYDQTDVRRVIDGLLSDHDLGQVRQALTDCGEPAASGCFEGEIEVLLAELEAPLPRSWRCGCRSQRACERATVPPKGGTSA